MWPKILTSTHYLPFMDNDGIIKMHTRLTELLSEQYKYPIILAKGRLAELIIWDTHERLLHSGPAQTKRDTRARFWVLGGKRYVSSVIHGCNHKKCLARRLSPVIQPQPDLPIQRLENCCYKFVSLDGMGPFLMKKCEICNFSAACETCNKKKSPEELRLDAKKAQCSTKKV